jgi:hypothetical protein
VLSCMIGPYRWPDYFVNVHEQSPRVTLSPSLRSRVNSAKGLSRLAARSFAALRMTGLGLSVGEELSRSFEPCLTQQSLQSRCSFCSATCLLHLFPRISIQRGARDVMPQKLHYTANVREQPVPLSWYRRKCLSSLRCAQGQALSPFASLRVNSAKGLARRTKRSFAALRMTGRTPLKSAHEKPSLQVSSNYFKLLTFHYFQITLMTR